MSQSLPGQQQGVRPPSGRSMPAKCYIFALVIAMMLTSLALVHCSTENNAPLRVWTTQS